MALTHSFGLFLFLLSTHFCSLVRAAPWIVTALYQKGVTTEEYYRRTEVVTNVDRITATATSLPAPLSTITSINSDSGYEAGYYGASDVTLIQQLYPTGVGKPVTEGYYGDSYYDTMENAHTTIFKVNLTYSAPTGCSTKFTHTTAAEVSPPYLVQALLPRTAMATSLSVDSSRPFQATTYTYDVVYVDPTQIPTATLDSLSLQSRPTESYGTGSCSYYSSDSRYSSGDDDVTDPYGRYTYNNYYDDYNWFLHDHWMGVTPISLTLGVGLGWFGIFLLMGFVEAFVRFQRLMRGWQTRRGLPLCWSLTLIPLSLLLLVLFRKGYRARSQADAEILEKRWKAMSVWTKLRLFFVWGFRFKYPPMLGPAPPRVRTSKQPGKNPGPPLLNQTPPGSSPGSSHGDETGPANPEMAESLAQAPAIPPPVVTASAVNSDHPVGRAQ